MTTRINTIPRCWTRDPDGARPGQHAWGQICHGLGGCADWWLARSVADRRTWRYCPDPGLHGGPHVYRCRTDRHDDPPQPFTMWVCPGVRPILIPLEPR